MASSSSSKPGEDFKKKKALDEARKAGTAEPERDEEGNEINPHIPSWMASAPWYLDASAKPSLKHQRLREGVQAGAAQTIGGEWYSRGATLGPAATKFRKGACANCGAMTHKTSECTERPRAKGAKCVSLLLLPAPSPRILACILRSISRHSQRCNIV
jgi:pre-mRNA-processing factor SLU7